MNKLTPLLTLVFQVLISFIVLFIVYIIYALADVDEVDMVNGIGFLVFQPVFGFILTSITIISCLLLGLPIRLVQSVKQWWYTKPLLPLLGIFGGVLLLALSFYPTWTETQQVIVDGTPLEKQVPNTSMSITGWFTTAFFLLHFYPQSLLLVFRSSRLSNV